MTLPNKLKKILDPTMLRFIIVGLVNTLFGTAVMFFSYEILHLGYWVSSGANYFFGSILSFFLNKHFTFQSSEKGIQVVLRFVLNIILCWVLAYGLAQPLVTTFLENLSLNLPLDEQTTLKERIAMIVGMVLFTAFNYIGQRFFAFKQPKKSDS